MHSLKGVETGVYIVDSTSLSVCRNARINRHRNFEGLTARGPTTMGWLFGLKLHIVMNHRGELMAVKITPGNTSDLKPPYTYSPASQHTRSAKTEAARVP